MVQWRNELIHMRRSGRTGEFLLFSMDPHIFEAPQLVIHHEHKCSERKKEGEAPHEMKSTSGSKLIELICGMLFRKMETISEFKIEKFPIRVLMFHVIHSLLQWNNLTIARVVISTFGLPPKSPNRDKRCA